VPTGDDVAHRIPAGRLDSDDARAAFQELAAGKRAREIAREVHDEGPGKRLHYAEYID
jgi:hypothetical protein